MTTVLIAAAAALLIGVAIGARRTRRALQTSHGRARHKMPARVRRAHPVISGEIAMEDAIRTASMYAPPLVELTARPAPVNPPTVALPRIDGTVPSRPPLPRVDHSIRRTADDAGAGRPSPQFHPESRRP